MTITISNTRYWFLVPFSIKRSRLLGKMADLMTREGKCKISLKHLVVQGKGAQGMMVTSTGHRSHLEGAPFGQIWDNLSSKLIMMVNNITN